MVRPDGTTASIPDIVERVLPSVVNIALTRAPRRPQASPFFDNPFFRRFFGPEGRAPEPREQQGLGSGVIVSEDGVILTNHHVVAQASEIVVTTSDRREYTAKVIGADPKSDLAVIRISDLSEKLTAIEFGTSQELRLGDTVLAIGNPFGVGQTVTMGIVSATGRADLGIVDYEDFIQTDAAINPGNSGGALVNTEGRLVGINTAILSRTGGYMGIGFAIPTEMARPIMESLLEQGKVVRGWLGVGIQDIDRNLAETLGLEEAAGVLISDVSRNSPAARAGLERGDVVLTLNGDKVESSGRLRNAIAAAGAGQRVVLEILRNGTRRRIEIELGEVPADQQQPGMQQTPTDPGAASYGLSVEDLTPAIRRRLGVGAEVEHGVVLTGVEPGSAAARAGLEPGDLLLELNRRPIRSAAEFTSAWSKGRGRALLLVYRNGTAAYVVVERD